MIIGARAHNAKQAALLAESGIDLVEISVWSAQEFERDVKTLRRLQEAHGTAFFAHGPEEGKARDVEFLEHEMR